MRVLHGRRPLVGLSLLALLGASQRAVGAGVTLSWDRPVTRYVIECATTSAGPWTACGEVAVPVPRWTAPTETPQCYRVRAEKDRVLSSDWSNTWCPPTAPRELQGPTPEPPPRALPNAGMETAPWRRGFYGGTTGTFSWGTPAHSGLKAGALRAGTGRAWGWWESEGVPLPPGRAVQVGLWVATERATAVTLYVSCRDATRQLALRTVAQHTGSTGWRQLSGLVTPPDGTTQVRVHVRCDLPAGVWCRVDDATLTEVVP